jgi:hypothetical protein
MRHVRVPVKQSPNFWHLHFWIPLLVLCMVPEEPHLPVTINDVVSVSNDTFLLGPTTNHPSTNRCRHNHYATQVSFGSPFPHECMPIVMSLPDHPVPHPGGILPESTDQYYPSIPTAFSFFTASATTNPPSMTNLSRRKGRIKYSRHPVPIQKATNPPFFCAAPKVPGTQLIQETAESYKNGLLSSATGFPGCSIYCKSRFWGDCAWFRHIR